MTSRSFITSYLINFMENPTLYTDNKILNKKIKPFIPYELNLQSSINFTKFFESYKTYVKSTKEYIDSFITSDYKYDNNICTALCTYMLINNMYKSDDGVDKLKLFEKIIHEKISKYDKIILLDLMNIVGSLKKGNPFKIINEKIRNYIGNSLIICVTRKKLSFDGFDFICSNELKEFMDTENFVLYEIDNVYKPYNSDEDVNDDSKFIGDCYDDFIFLLCGILFHQFLIDSNEQDKLILITNDNQNFRQDRKIITTCIKSFDNEYSSTILVNGVQAKVTNISIAMYINLLQFLSDPQKSKKNDTCKFASNNIDEICKLEKETNKLVKNKIDDIKNYPPAYLSNLLKLYYMINNENAIYYFPFIIWFYVKVYHILKHNRKNIITEI